MKHGCGRLLVPTTGFIEENCGHQELPRVVEKGFLDEVVGGARRGPLLERLPSRRAEVCVDVLNDVTLRRTAFFLKELCFSQIQKKNKS